jgi:hypothetical protein
MDAQTQTYIHQPTVVFHGSPVKTLTDGILKPRAVVGRPRHPDSVIFASPDIAFASMFILQAGDDWMTCGSRCTDLAQPPIYYFMCSDKERFMREDHGGAIYMLPSQPFKRYMADFIVSSEVIAHEAVKPLTSIPVESALETMLQLGVQVFFVDQVTYDSFVHAKSMDEKMRIYERINRTSENYRRGINYRSLLV